MGVAVIRGRAGSRRQTPPDTSKYGIWESKNGGAKWKNYQGVKNELHGATDLAIDPQNPNILYARFWGDAIYARPTAASTGPSSWPASRPNATFGTGGGTRFALGISHPAGQRRCCTRASSGRSTASDQPSQIWKSVDGGAWQLLPHSAPGGDDIADYCGDAVLLRQRHRRRPDQQRHRVRPRPVQLRHRLGRRLPLGRRRPDLEGPRLRPPSGLPRDRHRPGHPSHVLIGSDGGVWYSETWAAGSAGDELAAKRLAEPQRHGRPEHRRRHPSDRPADHPVHQHRQRSDPAGPGVGRHPGQRHAPQVDRQQQLVRRRERRRRPGPRRSDRRQLRLRQLLRHQPVPEPMAAGLVLLERVHHQRASTSSDRSEFYVPEIMNQGNPNQLFFGTYRLYRTDNAKADRPPSVHWHAISPDLTSGCTGGAPNGARGCFLSAIGVSSGGDGVYAGTLEGWVWYSPDARHQPRPDVDPGRQEHLPEPARQRLRGRPVERPDRLCRVQRLQRRHPEPAGSRLQDDRRRQALEGHQLEHPGRAGQLAPARRQLSRTPSMPAPTSARS